MPRIPDVVPLRYFKGLHLSGTSASIETTLELAPGLVVGQLELVRDSNLVCCTFSP